MRARCPHGRAAGVRHRRESLWHARRPIANAQTALVTLSAVHTEPPVNICRQSDRVRSQFVYLWIIRVVIVLVAVRFCRLTFFFVHLCHRLDRVPRLRPNCRLCDFVRAPLPSPLSSSAVRRIPCLVVRTGDSEEHRLPLPCSITVNNTISRRPCSPTARRHGQLPRHAGHRQGIRRRGKRHHLLRRQFNAGLA